VRGRAEARRFRRRRLYGNHARVLEEESLSMPAVTGCCSGRRMGVGWWRSGADTCTTAVAIRARGMRHARRTCR
jgi:hypothetical protein